MAGRHPHEDTELATAPRRLTVDDVGIAPKEQCTWSENSFTGRERSPPIHAVTQSMHAEHESDEDPFGFGFDIDEA